MADYLSEGINQAATARQAVSNDWSDTWKNYAVQYALAQQEFENNKEMWNLMNEYNSPSSQMARFNEAGLNPNLIYTQGSPGNASSPVSYSRPNVDIKPTSDRLKTINQVSEVVGLVSNVANNISNLIDQGLNVQLKRNQVAASNFDFARMNSIITHYGDRNFYGEYKFDSKYINPLSPDFDPAVFSAYQKLGHIPEFWNQYLTGQSSRLYQSYKSDYQKYYNENLLPLFKDYQEGKLSLQEIERSINDYNKTAIEMLPPEIRGIIAPLVQYLSPFMKFIFKHNQISH